MGHLNNAPNLYAGFKSAGDASDSSETSLGITNPATQEPKNTSAKQKEKRPAPKGTASPKSQSAKKKQ